VRAGFVVVVLCPRVGISFCQNDRHKEVIMIFELLKSTQCELFSSKRNFRNIPKYSLISQIGDVIRSLAILYFPFCNISRNERRLDCSILYNKTFLFEIINNRSSIQNFLFLESTLISWPNQRICRTARFCVCSRKKRRGNAVVIPVSEKHLLKKLRVR